MKSGEGDAKGNDGTGVFEASEYRLRPGENRCDMKSRSISGIIDGRVGRLV